MTGSGYPNFIGDDAFARIIDEYRCRATHDGRRCQLYAGHLETDGEHHAHGQLGPGPRNMVRNARIIRWDDDGKVWPHDGRRLRWCCLYKP